MAIHHRSSSHKTVLPPQELLDDLYRFAELLEETNEKQGTKIVDARNTIVKVEEPMESAEISLKDVDQLTKSSFPLCMRHQFDKLKEDLHLEHGGRMQLGLFLKSPEFVEYSEPQSFPRFKPAAIATDIDPCLA
ncbi:hypothetical protein RYX36_012789 [Vicia faba]